MPTFKVKIGSVIPHRRLKIFEKTSDLGEYLRFRTYLLALAFRGEKRLINLPLKLEKRPRRMENVVPQQKPLLLRKEVDSLPQEQRLIVNDVYEVY